MSVAIVTGCSGLIGSEAVKFFHRKGFEVVGIDNNMREYFFGKDGSVEWNTRRLKNDLPHFTHFAADIRNEPEINKIFQKYGKNIEIVIHAAAQPSHDWAAKEPITDFTVNANGTLIMLEAVREFCPDAPFIFTSTNKVYGDTPNLLPLVETATRWEIDCSHKFFERGIDETMTIDDSKHSVFGASKVAADVMTQEYGRYFGIKTGTFRGGCLTGPAHSGAELHGFLAYLIKCAVYEKQYTIFGYKGKQVRDNIHSNDLVGAFWHFYQNPKAGAIYNMGGSRHSNCSMLEAIEIVERAAGKKLSYSLGDKAREGDHIWYISDVSKFQKDYPEWRYEHGLEETVSEMVAATVEKMRDESRQAVSAAAASVQFVKPQSFSPAAARRPTRDYGKQNVLGVGVNAVDYAAALEYIIAAAKEKRPLAVSALAVHGVMTGALDAVHRHRLNGLELVVPDGHPVRWAMKWLHGIELPDRVYGPTLTLKVCEQAAAENLSVYLYGSRQEILEKLEANLLRQFPKLKIAGKQPSRFRQLTAEEQIEIAGEIRDSGASIVLVGLGCPRQETWVFENRDLLPLPLLAVGAAFDFHAGIVPQAPEWMQRRGLEWLFRLAREPRRLFHRYVVLNPLYLTLLFLQMAKLRTPALDETVAPTTRLRFG